MSAGIHGDEPAATEALIAWAEGNLARLARLPLLILPCLNPWGLLNNSRFNEDGIDLNRMFHEDSVEVIRALKRLLAPHQFALSLVLHEDYDGRGIYLYEVQRAPPYWGETLLAAAAAIVPLEGRLSIEGRRARAGVVRRRFDPKRFPMMPEAIYLHLHHSERTFTVETPSEFSLEVRIRAHLAVIEAAICQLENSGGLRT